MILTTRIDASHFFFSSTGFWCWVATWRKSVVRLNENVDKTFYMQCKHDFFYPFNVILNALMQTGFIFPLLLITKMSIFFAWNVTKKKTHKLVRNKNPLYCFYCIIPLICGIVRRDDGILMFIFITLCLLPRKKNRKRKRRKHLGKRRKKKKIKRDNTKKM